MMEQQWLVILFSMLAVSVYAQETIQYSVWEQSPVKTFLGNVGEDSNLRATASEADFQQISYSFLSQVNTYEDYFTINTQNGSIYTKTVIDREAIAICEYESTCVLSLSVVAKSKISAFFRSLKVNITVLDINDHAPTFTKQQPSLEISELATVGSAVALIGAEDADSGRNSLQRYFILDNSTDIPFNTSYERYYDGTSVVKLLITGDLDRESRDQYTLVIVAEDGGEPKLTGTMTVTINIKDTNDNSPVFTESQYNITVNETTAVGSQLLQLSATDDDIGINSEIVYRLSRNQVGKIHELFDINGTSGILSLKGKFDAGGQFRVIVEASDKGVQPLMAQVLVIVNVIDSNNNPPEIKINLFSSTGMAAVSEYAEIGTVVAHISLIDKDTGINGMIACDIASDKDVFKLQGLDVNEYKVTVAKGLDRESLDYIYVVVNCHDKGVPPLNSFTEFTVEVTDENDNTPKFRQSVYFVDIYENNDINTDLVQVSAFDNDINQNGEISYSLWAPGNYQYQMDPQSGIIKLISVYDREMNTSLTIFAYAKDNGSPARTSTATIIVSILDQNDNDPVFVKPLYEFTIQENLPAGTEVGVVAAKDADVGENARLGLYIDTSVPFLLDPSGRLTTKKALDREYQGLYNILAIVYDHGLPSRNSSANIVVHITDQNDNTPIFIFPDASNYTVEVDADLITGTVVATIKAYDLDDGKNGELFYSMVSQNLSDLITIDGFNGEISLLRPVALTDPEIINVVLRVDDNGNPRLSSTSSVNLFISRKPLPPSTVSKKGENLLIAITVGSVTFVLVFTFVLIICLLRRRSGSRTNDSNNSESKFYDKEISMASRDKRVQFSDADLKQSSNILPDKNVFDSVTTFSCDPNVSRDSDMTSSSTDTETPILDQGDMNLQTTPVKADQFDINSSSVPQGRRHSTPRSDTQLSTLHSHSALLSSAGKAGSNFSTFGHDDNHSQTSGETVTSDSGRGGSESDVHSTSLSHSHDSDTRSIDCRTSVRQPANSTFIHDVQPWMNLGDLRYHNFHKAPVAQQLRKDQNLRLQIRNLSDHNRQRVPEKSVFPVPRRVCTDRHTVGERSKFVTFKEPPQNSSIFPPPPSDLDRSFMAYDDEDDDLSTTTSGSYTIDQHDLSLDMRSPDLRHPGLRGCLV